ncbi:MAG TPA: ABC transporter ATP-binding protein [Conexivisphaerales archaeon]|nr:ABC transporter ATP-binding protein [Conexivisphaerales archaeon]
MNRGELVCTDLTKVYSNSGGGRALDSVTMSVPSHGIFTLIGKNGAGKTTLVRILATQLEPTQGSAYINGIDVVKEARKLRDIIATVPQEARAIPWLTPLQTVVAYMLWRGYGYAEAKSRADEALAKAGLAQYAETVTRKLSGGLKRKVMVATALAADAEVTFLDEPTTGLDPMSRRELWKSLEEIAKDRFLILTTHYLEEAERMADTLGILDKGRLVALGTLDYLRSLVKYEYSIRFPTMQEVPSVEGGVVTSGTDGQTQIMTGEREAYRLSKELLERGAKFSINRISLDGIFFSLVGSVVDEEEQE